MGKNLKMREWARKLSERNEFWVEGTTSTKFSRRGTSRGLEDYQGVRCVGSRFGEGKSGISCQRDSEKPE